MTTIWPRRYAQRMNRMGSSIIRELLKLTQQPDLISFAGGLPAPELFPLEKCDQAAQRIITQYGAQALQYSTTEGYLPLRQLIAQQMSRDGLHVAPENILITNGAQQALDLVGKILINPGDLILTEQPTYLGALQAWQAYQANFISVPTDHDGILLDEAFERALQAGPKFMYILPSFQNPSGVTLSLERRHKLVELADHYGIPIIEDDPYSQLRYEGEHMPSLMAIDADWQKQKQNYDNGSAISQGNVIYMGTFSKTFGPGLRLGWIAAPTDVLRHCVMGKQGADLHTSTYAQMLLYEVAKDGFLDEHKQVIKKTYKERRDVMIHALEAYAPEGVTWTHPKGGLFLWVRIPDYLDSKEVLNTAIANKVAFVPGEAFYAPDGGEYHGHNTMRLNFSNAQPEQIELGIKRLMTAVATAMSEKQQEENGVAYAFV